MTINGRMMAVLELIRRQTTPVSLKNLQAMLDENFPERTLRRHVSKLIEAGLLEKLGNKRNTTYQANNTDHPIFSAENMAVINKTHLPLSQRNPVTYNPEWLNAYIPNKTQYLKNKVIKTLEKHGKKLEQSMPAGTYARKIYNRLLIDLSYNSSRLEGNTYSLIDTEKLILEGKQAEGKLNEETLMILNHKEAIRYLVEHAQQIKMTENEIYTIHYLLSDALIDASCSGAVRNHGVRISHSTYVPYEDSKRLSKQLQLICQKAKKIKNPYEQSFFLLTHIAYLQAFIDVNKRTSRLCANIPLIKNNLVPLSFNDIDMNDYISAMIAIYEFNNPQPLANIYEHSYLKSCQLYDVTIEAIGFDEIRARYRQERRAIIRHIISEKLTGKKMKNYLSQAVNHIAPAEDRLNILEDIDEDLREIAPHRIAGLGITLAQLETWLKLVRK